MLALIPGGLHAGGMREDRYFIYQGIHGIELLSGEMNVEILPTVGGSVTFDARNVGRELIVRHEVGSVFLRISTERETGFPATRRATGTAVLHVPQGTVVRVYAGSGDLRARDLSASRLAVTSRTGSVRIENYGAELEINTAEGSITVIDSRGRKLLRSSTGSINVVGSTGDIETSSSLGPQRFERIEGRLYVSGGTGDVDVRDLRGGVRVFTSTGAITATDILLTEDAEFRTNIGTIRAAFLNDPSQVDFELSTITGEISLDGRTSTSTISIDRGRAIDVTGRCTAGRQIYTFQQTPGLADPPVFDPVDPARGP